MRAFALSQLPAVEYSNGAAYIASAVRVVASNLQEIVVVVQAAGHNGVEKFSGHVRQVSEALTYPAELQFEISFQTSVAVTGRISPPPLRQRRWLKV